MEMKVLARELVFLLCVNLYQFNCAKADKIWVFEKFLLTIILDKHIL